MAFNQQNANIPCLRRQDQFLEFLVDRSIPVPEYSTGIHTKKRNYLRKGTGLMRYNMKPKQNINNRMLNRSEIPEDRSVKKLFPNLETSEDGIKPKRALKRPHDNGECSVDNLSNVSLLNDSVAEKQELLMFERLEKATANLSMCSSYESECTEKQWLGQLDCSSIVSDCAYPLFKNPIEPLENAPKSELLAIQQENADKEIKEILETLRHSNTVSHDDEHKSSEYNDEEAWRKLMEMASDLHIMSPYDTTNLSQPSGLYPDNPSYASLNNKRSVASQCSQSNKDTGIQVNSISNKNDPSYEELQETTTKQEAEIHMYKTKCSDLYKLIKDSTAEKEKVKKEINQLALAESQLKKKVQEIGQQKAKLNHLHANDKKLLNKKTEECAILKKQLKEINDNFQTKENQYKAIETRNKKFIAEVASLNKKIDSLTKQLSNKLAPKVDKTTSTRDITKLNKQLKEESLINALTIRDVVPKKSIPNFLTRSVSTQVYPGDVEICPIVCNVTKEFEPFKIPTLQTEQGYTGISPVTNCADNKSRIGAVTNHTQDNLNISPVVVSSTDKFKIGPVIGTTIIKLEGVKSDVDANSVKPKVSSNFVESIPTVAQAVQKNHSSEKLCTYKNGKTNKTKLSTSISYHKKMSDGAKVTVFLNGTKQFSSADGKQVKVLYVNGDILKKDYSSNTESYYFASHNSWQTKHCDGRKVLEFQNGQTETYYPNGTKRIELPDGTECTLFQSGFIKWVLQDGTTHLHTIDGKRLSLFKNGQKELHLKMITVRQYPDGTASIKYPNGTVETIYWNGRRRVKNKFGVLISDTGLI